MYNPQLKAFVTAADCGSFTKAAEKLFISPTAVMKQINALENHLGLKLISRTNQGVKLTPAGQSIYKDALFIFDYSEKSVEKAKRYTEEYEKTFCVGTSILNPCKPFMDLWYKLSPRFPGYRLNIVPFEDEHTNIVAEISSLGEKFDFLTGVCDSATWLDRCGFLKLGEYKKCIAVNANHRLAKKKIIRLSDLYGENLMMVKAGDSAANDRIRAELTKNHPQIHLVDTPHFYDMSVFNRCAQSDDVLLTIECWQDVHPLLVTIPVEWDYTIPYGILYAKEPPEDVKRLIGIVEEITTIKEKKQAVRFSL
ncbi:MAG: LysR family transcriptional regulator [Oscillospiraceae bacterium]|nr:LysR family transcriptional regulator [Oscillospiraceae bacterium]